MHQLNISFLFLPEEIAARLAAAGVSGDAAKQMMAAVQSGGGRKYLPFIVLWNLNA